MKDNVYGAVIMAESLRECTGFMWWMQNSARWLPTFAPSWPTWTANLHKQLSKQSYTRHPPLPFILLKPDSSYSFYGRTAAEWTSYTYWDGIPDHPSQQSYQPGPASSRVVVVVCPTHTADATQLDGVGGVNRIRNYSWRRLPMDSVDSLETGQTDSIAVLLRDFWPLLITFSTMTSLCRHLSCHQPQ